MDLVKKHSMCLSVQCVRQIHSFLSIPMSDIQILHVCVTICDQNPDMIGMEIPKLQDAEESGGAVTDDAFTSLMTYNTQTNEDYSGFTNNILSFQLVTTNTNGNPELLGVNLLMHMSTYYNQNIKREESDGRPTVALDVNIGERQMECIQPTNVEILKGRIISNSGGQSEKPKVAMWKLDSLGYIQERCSFLTDTERINRVSHNLELADTIAEIKQIKDAASAEKKDDHETKMIELAPNPEKL